MCCIYLKFNSMLPEVCMVLHILTIWCQYLERWLFCQDNADYRLRFSSSFWFWDIKESQYIISPITACSCFLVIMTSAVAVVYHNFKKCHFEMMMSILNVIRLSSIHYRISTLSLNEASLWRLYFHTCYSEITDSTRNKPSQCVT